MDHDRVALAHVLASQLVDVVQGRPGDGGARHHHGVEFRDRREDAGAPHLHADCTQDGAPLLRRKLEGNRPARRARREAQGTLAGERVNLHDDAIDIVVKLLAMRKGILAVGVDLGRALYEAGVRVHREAAVREPGKKVMLGAHLKRSLVRNGVDEGPEVTGAGDLGVLLAQTPCSGIAWICEGCATGSVALLVQPHEARLGHVDLAAHLHALAQPAIGDTSETRRLECPRDVLDRERVGRDVLARGAVTARRRPEKLPVRVGEGDAETVYLELAGIGNGLCSRGTERLVCAGKPLVELRKTHRVIDGVHATGMEHRLELPRDVAADALGVAVRAHKLGVFRLEGDELLQPAVELSVAHLGLVERVVGIGGVLQDAVELSSTLSQTLPAGGDGPLPGLSRPL